MALDGVAARGDGKPGEQSGEPAEVLRRNGLKATVLRKQHDGRGPGGEQTTVDAINAGEIDLIVNTPYGVGSRLDGYEIRTAAVRRGIPCITTVQGASAAVQGIEAAIRGDIDVRSLQELHAALGGS